MITSRVKLRVYDLKKTIAKRISDLMTASAFATTRWLDWRVLLIHLLQAMPLLHPMQSMRLNSIADFIPTHRVQKMLARPPWSLVKSMFDACASRFRAKQLVELSIDQSIGPFSTPPLPR